MQTSSPVSDGIRKNMVLLTNDESAITLSRKEDDMTKRSHAVRRHTRIRIRCPVLYGTRDFLGNGTILDVTASGCRVTGTMPVEVGMRLRLWGAPAEKPEPLQITEATVVRSLTWK
jgi:hypothetical protein